MRIPLTIGGLPELASLSDAERATLLKSCDAPGPLRLWSYNLSRGIFLAALLFLVLHWGGISQSLAGAFGAIVLVLATLVFAVLMHIVTIVRVRGQFRLAMEAGSRGGLVPICLRCGHDCSTIDSNRCPECGASRLVPARSEGHST
jgi:DNA-directed RNA polymerase subunit RPC12/RpoP